MSGKRAGYNMAGAKKPYSHQSMFWSDLGPAIGYEAVGLTDSKLETVGVWAKGVNPRSPDTSDEGFNKGVVFYMNKQKKIVGVLMWNMFGKVDVARTIIKSGKSYENPKEVATLFNVHG